MKNKGSFAFGIVVGIAATYVYNTKIVQGWIKKGQDKYLDLKKQVQDKVRERKVEEDLNNLSEEIEEAINKTNN